MSNEPPEDASLLALFRQEAETHTAALSQGLIEWENNTTDISKIEPLMRAAHSLKGAARIVGLDAYSQLAHTLEDCFVAAQKEKITLEATHYDTLLKAVDFLSDITKIPEDEMLNWPGERIAELESIQKDILSIQSDQEKKEPKALLSTPEPAEPSPTADQQKQDTSLQSVFANELIAQVTTLKYELTNLKSGPPATTKQLEPLIVAAASIKGVSNIVKKCDAEHLAASLEESFRKAQNREIVLDSNSIETLLRGVDLLTQFASKDVESNTIKECIHSIHSISSAPRQTAPPKKTKQATKSTTPTTPSPQKEPSKDIDTAAVRVSAGNLNRIMGIAAESVVETRRLQPIKQSLLQLKTLHHQLAHVLDAAQNEINKSPTPFLLESIGKQVSDNSNTYRTVIQNLLEHFHTFSRNNNALSSRLYREVLTSRMRPFSEGVQGFPRLVRNLSRSLEKNISLDITGEDTPVDRDILEKLEAPLNHLIRNACDHGIETPEERLKAGKQKKGTVRIHAFHKGGMLVLTISDDGHGIDKQKVRDAVLEKQLATEAMVKTLSDDEILAFLFLPGFSTTEKVTEISGRGVGLDIVHNLIQEVGGSARIETALGKGTTFYIQLPITRSVIRCLMIEVDGEPYAFPLSEINRTLRLDHERIKTIENREYFSLEDQNVAIFSPHEVLGLKSGLPPNQKTVSLVVLGENNNQYSIAVDRISGETELVVRPLDPRLGKVPCIRAASINDEGIPVLILDADDLLQSTDKLSSEVTPGKPVEKKQKVIKKQKNILVVDDSLTVRETERHLLQNAGYHVEVAVDGTDGWNTLVSGNFDLVVTDIDMPRMNGLELIALIKKDPKLKKIPVIIVSYKDRDEDRQEGLEAGADYFLTKSSFRDDTFINVVRDFIGEA